MNEVNKETLKKIIEPIIPQPEVQMSGVVRDANGNIKKS
jgi:hypothetical protein